MKIEKIEVYSTPSNQDFRSSDDDPCLMDKVKDGQIIEAKDRPEAGGYTIFYDNGVAEHYLKRNMRKEIFSPRDASHVGEHKKTRGGLPYWDWQKVPPAAMIAYKHFLIGKATSLSKVRQMIVEG